MAADYQHVATHEGVEVMVQYDPMGPNNLIVANVKFVNENKYGVAVSWMPIITCEGDYSREGPVAGFSMNEGETYVVTIWRSAACGPGRIKNFSVNMDAKKANP